MQTQVPFNIIPIEEDGFHLQLSGKINDNDVNLLIDTGASRSVFDENKIKAILGENLIEEIEKLSTGLGTNSMQSKKAVLESFKIGDIHLHNYEVAVLDLSHVNQSYTQIGLDEIAGVIGSDLLYDMKAVIDYDKSTLTLNQ
ncbi:MAG TPA: clan AA aspartic protease [Flavobacteriales bacterium]|nr:clan AA aspartic protease [Flavobacteriales bacterium]|tara:strand:- start:132715 stop:133140 length:426 start_codon:yes stop_codon:yes gene_type:complete